MGWLLPSSGTVPIPFPQEDVDAADDIITAFDAVDTADVYVRRAFAKLCGWVACAVAYQRHHFTVEGGRYQFPRFTVRTGSPVSGLIDFNQIAIFQRCMPFCSAHSKRQRRAVHSVIPKLL